MDKVIAILGSEKVQALILVGVGALLTKLVQAKEVTFPTPSGPVNMKF